MFVFPAIALLFVFVYTRPQELLPQLRPFVLNLVLGVLALGMVLDLRLRVSRIRWSPLLVGMLSLYGWMLFSAVIKAPDAAGEQLVKVFVPLVAFLVVSQGLGSLRALEGAAALLLAFTLALAATGVYQGTNPKICYAMASGVTDTGVVDVPDGRRCDMRADCAEGGLGDRDYGCEHPGVLGTHSIGARVRFRGLLEDPNELAWTIAMGTPLAFALYERRRTLFRLLLLVAVVVLGFICVIMTQSRSGQIAMIAMLGVYFVRRFGWRGAALGVVGMLPLLLLGGRSGEAAESSSDERLGCWSEALAMWRESPIIGVGGGQFTEHHWQTAHNSFLLMLAEMGPVGLFIFSAVLYFAFKVSVRIQVELGKRGEAAAARSWATALLASQVGMVVSAIFLSLAYHAVLWIFLGLSAALYAAVRAHEPGFRVRFGWRDVSVILGVDFVLVAFIAVYLRLKGI